MPTKYIKKGTGQYEWQRGQIVHLFVYAYWRSNKQLSAEIGIKLTTTRNKIYEWGLQKEEAIRWPSEQIRFMIDNFRTMSDAKMSAVFDQRWPKEGGKKWNRNHVGQRRVRRRLIRTPQETRKIFEASGAYQTIKKNSSTVNMHPSWLVNMFSRKESTELKDALKQDASFLAMAKNLILLKRGIKHAKGKNNRHMDIAADTETEISLRENQNTGSALPEDR